MFCKCCDSQMVFFNEKNNFAFFHCKKCGFWTTRKSDNLLPAHNYFNEPAFLGELDSDWKILVGEAAHIMDKKIDIMCKKGIEFSNDKNFLDIGCSEGLYLAAMKELGWNTFGFEVDEAKISRAKKKGLNVSAPRYSLLERESYDFIFSRHVMEHIPDFMMILNQAVSLLKVGGVLCVETPNMHSLLALLNVRKIKRTAWGAPGLVHVYPPTHIHGFTPRAWSNVGKKLGLKVLDIRTYAAAGDPDWNITSTYKGNFLKKRVYRTSAQIGLGESVSVFLRK